jgi:GNAT superfamily N-acetyltransferase
MEATMLPPDRIPDLAPLDAAAADTELNSAAREKVARARQRRWACNHAMSTRGDAEFCAPRPQGRHAVYSRRLTVIARPLVEAEWKEVRAFVQRIAADDLRLRFGRALNFQDEAILRRFFDVVPGGGEIAWVCDEAGAIAGMVHRIKQSPAEAEIALLVRSDLKRRGIGEFLAKVMLARSAREGVKRVTAFALWENRAVLQLGAKIGFVAHAEGAGAVELGFAIERTRLPDAA